MFKKIKEMLHRFSEYMNTTLNEVYKYDPKACTPLGMMS